MALVEATLKAQLLVAFAAPTWALCGPLIGVALDVFIMTGTVKTDVTGSGVTPEGVPFTITTGKGAGAIITTGSLVLQAAILSKIINPTTTWADLGSAIADGVDADIKTGSVATVVTGGLTGIGSGLPGCINTSSTFSAFKVSLVDAFQNPATASSWTTVADAVATAMKTYLTGAIITTTDSGLIPAVSWAGFGTGKIS